MTEPISIRPGQRVFMLTGAGVSAESGIRTFRECGGLWEEFRVEDVATPEGFAADPDRVWAFYNKRRAELAAARPNPAHTAIARLEELLGSRFLLVTQNVDDLHERAGSQRLLHMHGELLKTRCTRCGLVLASDRPFPNRPRCGTCGGFLRPHIVWFSETPFDMPLIEERVRACDWFFAVGTSGQVYPAAQLIVEAAAWGAKTVVVNPDPEARSRYADYFIGQPAGQALPALVDQWVAS